MLCSVMKQMEIYIRAEKESSSRILLHKNSPQYKSFAY